MNEETITDALLREFLLGKVNDEDRERIENLFLTDAQARERLLEAEQELIEDYLDDSLTAADKEIFVSLFAQTDEQRRKLRITKSIMDWAVTEAPLTQPVPAYVSRWDRLRSWLRLNPAVVPIAATLAIAVVAGAVWLSSRTNGLHSVIETELAQLNTLSKLQEVPSQMTSFELSPGAVRGTEQQLEIGRRDSIQLVEFRLRWPQKDPYPKYQARIQRIGGAETYTIPNIPAQSDGPHTIRLRLPMHMLQRGHYRINLVGNAADGTTSFAEEYTFGVSN